MLVKIFVKLALLKPVEEITSDFLRLENSKIFDCVWVHISGKPQTSPSKNPEAITAVPAEKVLLFFLNLNNLWGDWLAP